MANSANTIRDVIRRGVILTPPEAVALWESALENDPEGCAEFARVGQSGFSELVEMGRLGFKLLPTTMEFDVSRFLGEAVHNPFTRSGIHAHLPSTPRFPIYRRWYAFVRDPRLFRSIYSEMTAFATADAIPEARTRSARDREMEKLRWESECNAISFAYEEFLLGSEPATPEVVVVGQRYMDLATMFFDHLTEIAANPKWAHLRGVFCGVRLDRQVLVYG